MTDQPARARFGGCQRQPSLDEEFVDATCEWMLRHAKPPDHILQVYSLPGWLEHEIIESVGLPSRRKERHRDGHDDQPAPDYQKRTPGTEVIT